MNLGAGERTQDKIRRVAARRVALSPSGRRSASPSSHRARDARAAGAVLPRLVPPRPDGGDRRRRRRPQCRGGDDHGGTSRRSPSPSRSGRGPRSTCPSSRARATPSSPTRRRPPRSCSSATCGRRATRARSAAIATSCSTSCSRGHARRPGWTNSAQRANPPFLRAAADRGLFPAPRTKDEAIIQALVSNDGVSTGPRRAGDRAAAGRAVRLHRDRARRARSRRRWRATSASSRKAPTVSPRAAPTSTRATSSRAKRCRRSGRSWRSTGGSCPASRWREINALAGDWFPEQNRLVVVSAPEAAGVVLPDRGAARRGRQGGRRRSRSSPTSMPRAGQALMDAPPARGSDRRRRPSGRRPGSRSGRCRTAPPSCCEPTTLKADQILFRAFAPGGTSLASDADFIAARVADEVDPGRRRRSASAP